MAFVTRCRWKEASAEAKLRIAEASFVAVDLELSGINTTQWRSGSEVESLQTRYLNLRDSAHKFALLQFGLCPFVWDATQNKYIAHPFNFCVFPRDELPIEMPARDFLCQATSLEFLAKHKFDFNAWIHDGISYLSREEEAIARQRLGLACDAAERQTTAEIPLTRTADVLFSESVRIKAGEWRDRKQREENDTETCLVVEVSGTYQANLVHQVLRKKFEDLVSHTADCRRKVKVYFPKSSEERAELLRQLEEMKRKATEAQLMDAVGFRLLIEALADSGKPLVGHNCFLDFAHIYCKFFGTLPSSCTSYCSSIHREFPWIFDTKYLLKTRGSLQELFGDRSTTLGVVYSNLLESKAAGKVRVELGSSAGRYLASNMKHEAGYDAFITGVVFANICQVFKFDHAMLGSLRETQAPADEGSLASFANLLYLGWRSQFVLDLSTGVEATGAKVLKMHRGQGNSRSERAALVWGCKDSPEKHVTGFFPSKPEMEVVSIDQESAFVIFKKKESLDMLVAAAENSSSPSGFNAARYEMFEKLCGSPLATPKLTEALQLLTEESPRKKPRLE